MQERKCLNCKKQFPFLASPSRGRNRGKCCSRKCFFVYRSRNRQHFTCPMCLKDFTESKSVKRVNCSLECYWKSKIGKPLSEIHRKNISKANSGEKAHRWRGGITSENQRIRNGIEIRIWRDAVFERDNYTCVVCGIKSYKGLGYTVKLQADHIKPFAFFPESRFDIDNGRTLCEKCHKETETWGNKTTTLYFRKEKEEKKVGTFSAQGRVMESLSTNYI